MVIVWFSRMTGKGALRWVGYLLGCFVQRVHPIYLYSCALIMKCIFRVSSNVSRLAQSSRNKALSHMHDMVSTCRRQMELHRERTFTFPPHVRPPAFKFDIQKERFTHNIKSKAPLISHMHKVRQGRQQLELCCESTFASTFINTYNPILAAMNTNVISIHFLTN